MELPKYGRHKDTLLIAENVETKAQRKTRKHYELWLNDKREDLSDEINAGKTNLNFDNWLIRQELGMPISRRRRHAVDSTEGPSGRENLNIRQPHALERNVDPNQVVVTRWML